MAGRGIDRLGMARGGAVTAAIIWRAEMRAAFQDLARNLDLRLAGIVARVLAAAARVLRDAAGLRRIGLVPGRPPVGGPFPDIADHVADAVAVRRKRGHRRGALIAVLTEILDREISLPDVRHVLAIRRQCVAPGKLLAIETATRGEFPFGFARQILAGPSRIGQGIATGDV